MLISFLPTGVIRLSGRILLGISSPVTGLVRRIGSEPNGLTELRTSPTRSAAVGAKDTMGEPPLNCRKNSALKKKKVLFFLMGPPMVPPN